MSMTINVSLAEEKPKLIFPADGKIDGFVGLVDEDRPPIYRIKANRSDNGVFELDDKLVHSIVLDGLYTSMPDLEKEELKSYYRRRGRNIEVILDEPFFVKEFPDLPFYVVTFKGAGAKLEDSTDEQYKIDPFNWPSEDIFQHKRIWGGLDEGFAIGEAENKILSQRNIFHTPYVAQNKIPEIIQREIYRKAYREKRRSDANLYQVVRLSMTNIRHSDFLDFNSEKIKDIAERFLSVGWTLEKWVEHLGKVDGKLIKECLKLAVRGKFLQFSPLSDFEDNTYITGEITDLEQVIIGKYGENEEKLIWPVAIMYRSESFLEQIALALGEYNDLVTDAYFEKVSETSGYEFNNNSGTLKMQYTAYHSPLLQKFSEKVKA